MTNYFDIKQKNYSTKSSNAKKIFNIISQASFEKLASVVEQDSHLSACREQIGLYSSPSGYIEWNTYVKFCLVNGSLQSMMHCFAGSDARGAVITKNVRSAISGKAPARYISKEIIDSFAETAIPVLTKDVLDIFPYMHILLPRHTVYDAEGDEVLSILLNIGKIYSDTFSKESEQITKTFFPDENIIPSELLGASGIEISTLTAEGMDAWQEFIDENAKSWHEENVKTETSKYANKATEKIIRIAINSLLVHLYEPELITTDSKRITSGIGFSSGKKAPLSPTWIGRTFKCKKEKLARDTQSGEVRGGVRSHWRRGHWHTVVYGRGRSERRVQWFKPVFVNS